MFNFDFEAYLKSKGVKFCCLSVFKSQETELMDCHGLCGDFDQEIIEAVKEKGFFYSKAGYYSYHNKQFQFSNPTDILFVADDLLTDNKTLLAILYHEICHALIEHKVDNKIKIDLNEIAQGKLIRKYTQYQFEDGHGHTDKWFALLYAGSFKMARCFSKYFDDPEDVVETALKFDKTDEKMDTVNWNKK